MPQLRLHNLTLGYDRHPAVHHLDGLVKDGAALAVVGPNGAGKSTLLKAIAGTSRGEAAILPAREFDQRLADADDMRCFLTHARTLSRRMRDCRWTSAWLSPLARPLGLVRNRHNVIL